MAMGVPAQNRKHSVKKRTGKAKITVRKKTNSKKNNSKTVVYTNASIRGLQGQRSQIQKKIREQKQALQKNQADVKQRLDNLVSLNAQIDERQKNIDGIHNDIHDLNGNIDILKAQLKTLEQQLAERKSKYIKSMRYMARHRTVQDKLMFIFSAKNFAQMYRRLRFVREYADFQKAQGEMVKAKQAQVNGKHIQLKNIRGHKSNLLHKGEQEKSALQGQQEEQKKVVASLQDQQKTIQKVIAEQHQKDAALNAQIDRLVAREVAKAQARAAAEAKKRAAVAAAAKKRAAELAIKKAEAEAAARENARRIAMAKAREAKLKAEAEAAARAAEAARRARAEAYEAKKRAVADAQARAAAEKQAEAEQAAREAEAQRVAAERKAKVEAVRQEREIAEVKKENEEVYKYTTVDRMMNGGFEANRGRLPMPISGGYKIVSHYGQYNVAGLNNVTLDNKGINIQGHAGAVARSVYDGEVSAVIPWSGTYVVMVRHGAYISVYCNLRSVAVSRGMKVSTRQALGNVGANNILQFQLRKGSAKLNPEAWLGR